VGKSPGIQRISLALGIAGVVLAAKPSLAVECKAVGGHINGEPVAATRRAKISGYKIVLNGTFGGVKGPTRTLPCTPLYSGVLCERLFGPVLITVMTNRNRMLETVTDRATGREQAKFSYVCNGPLKF
jgi:hypothetical protein